MTQQKQVPIIGLVGGIGSGKSAVAAWVAKKHSVVVIDADQIGHQTLQQPVVQQKIRQQFGETVFDNSGNIDRSILAQKVFGSLPEHQQLRTTLEQIVHPEIEKIIQGTISEAFASKTTDAIFLDAAILFETHWNKLCDAVVFVDTPFEQRLQRVQENRQWTTEELRKRESNQLDIELKRNHADFTISNDNHLEHAGQQLEQLMQQLMAQ